MSDPVMRTSLSRHALAEYVRAQVQAFFPDRPLGPQELQVHVDEALERLEHCFAHIRVKYYSDGRHTTFDHLHTDQWTTFLYFLSNTIHRSESNPPLAQKVYALNKALHSIDVSYAVELPAIFAFQHPVGTVVGRGRFSDYLLIYQRCSVGSNLNGSYPSLGQGVVMFGGSSVIGDCTLGDNVWISAGTTVMDQSVPSSKVVFGSSPNLIVKDAKRDAVREMFLRARRPSDGRPGADLPRAAGLG